MRIRISFLALITLITTSISGASMHETTMDCGLIHDIVMDGVSMHETATDEALIYEVSEFGVRPDVERVNTGEIQKALDEVARKGGGVLRFSKGDYVTGTVEIPSGVGIYLDRDARILGSVLSFICSESYRHGLSM